MDVIHLYKLQYQLKSLRINYIILPMLHSQHYSLEVMMSLNRSEVARFPFSVAVGLFKALGERDPVTQKTSHRNFTTIAPTLIPSKINKLHRGNSTVL